MSSLAAIKTSSHSRNIEDQSNTERQRDVLVLILSHLRSQGFIETATALVNESRSVDTLARYEVADNVDLMQILKEYDEYYKIKFGRRPVFCRSRNNPNGHHGVDESTTSSKHNARSKCRSANGDHGCRQSTDNAALPQLSSNQAPRSTSKPPRSCKQTNQEEVFSGDDQRVIGLSVNSTAHRNILYSKANELEPRPALKAFPNFDGDPELQSLAISLRRDIVQEDPRVKWGDIVGLSEAKRLLKEAIILPQKYPQLFTGLRSPWKSVLLYGVPGTGKTLLAKAVAAESNATFFNISASSVVSKYRGDSEKLIRVLFDLARHYSPSTIFIDEVDSIISHRGGSGSSASEGSEHEGSRRMKTELLVQMDGLLSTSSRGVFVLAATNLPWDLDTAFLRRMEKKIMIPLPTKECRADMIRSHLAEFSPIFCKGGFLEEAASLVDGYSGSDIRTLCKEVAMRPVRRVLADVEICDGLPDHENLSLLMKRNPVTAQDFREAISTVNHSTSAELCDRLMKWTDANCSSCS
ncbi:hypothetical protein ACHAW5_002331 [Stephanodiscus triporus]|uniref:AAA+ ATPase domain-containing protein n=1 Tax=Stephanodiscus triporus TaxID=2934178 RepID=A0ABD3N465_9STRA